MTSPPEIPAEHVATLADVAEHAGVSTATVSRCLNSPDQVKQATRDKVLNAVRELGYSPNFGARALAAKRTNTIGAIIPTMDNAIFARGLQAFQEELGKAGITLLVASSSYRPDLEEEQIRNLVARGADGLLLIGHERDDQIYEFLDRRKVPALIAWAYDPNRPKISIGFDNRLAMQALAQEVLNKGHQRIAIISAPQKGNDRARDRVLGVQAACASAKMTNPDQRLIETDYSITNGGTAFEALMAMKPRPTAVICGNDVLAVGAVQKAHSLGLRVPEDVSITGFDDIELARVTHPALTTVHVPHREMGRRAAQLLQQMVKTGGPVNSIRLKTDLRLRDTLAAPPD